MRTTALPGPGCGVGIVWMAGGEDVEFNMRARWAWGRVWVVIVAWIDYLEGGMGVFMLGAVEIGLSGWD